MSSEELPIIDLDLIVECCHYEYIEKYSKDPKFKDEHYIHYRRDSKYTALMNIIKNYKYKGLNKTNFNHLPYNCYLILVWKKFYTPTIFNAIGIYFSFQGLKSSLNLHPLTTIGKFREKVKEMYQFTDIEYVKLVYKNKNLDDNDLNLLSLNIKSNNDIIYIMTHEDNIDDINTESEVEEDAPSSGPESSIVEPEAPSPAPIPNIVQAEPINSTSSEITRLNDRINRLEATLESIIRHLDSAYEPE
jgi:hypothetical protein